jgi:hypothetical protein
MHSEYWLFIVLGLAAWLPILLLLPKNKKSRATTSKKKTSKSSKDESNLIHFPGTNTGGDGSDSGD